MSETNEGIHRSISGHTLQTKDSQLQPVTKVISYDRFTSSYCLKQLFHKVRFYYIHRCAEVKPVFEREREKKTEGEEGKKEGGEEGVGVGVSEENQKQMCHIEA